MSVVKDGHWRKREEKCGWKEEEVEEEVEEEK